MKLRTILAAAILAFPLSAKADVEFFECAVNAGPEDGNWISNYYQFQVKVEGDAAQVLDGVTDDFLGGPAAARVVKYDNKQIVLAWEVLTSTSSGQHAKMSYRLSYFRADGTVAVNGKPTGYDPYDARGTCKAK